METMERNMDKEVHKELEARARELVDEPCTQRDEFILAKKERRQPLCVYCQEPLDNIIEKWDLILVWNWSPEELKYVKATMVYNNGESKCDCCETKDREFTSKDFHSALYLASSM